MPTRVAGSVPAMDLSSVGVRRLLLLGEMIRLSDAGEQQVTAGGLSADPSDREEREALSADARALRDQELVHLDERFNGGGWLARPTRAGRDAWQDFVARRDNVAQRRARTRNDYLRWLYDNTRDGSYAVADAFLEARQTYLGAAYTQEDLIQAGAWLAARGFIDGPGVDQRPDPLRPRPTVKGEDYIESGKDVHKQTSAVGSTTYSIQGNAQIAHNSHNAIQVQPKESVREETLALVAALQQMLPAIAPDAQDQFAQLAKALRDEATGAARPSRLRAHDLPRPEQRLRRQRRAAGECRNGRRPRRRHTSRKLREEILEPRQYDRRGSTFDGMGGSDSRSRRAVQLSRGPRPGSTRAVDESISSPSAASLSRVRRIEWHPNGGSPASTQSRALHHAETSRQTQQRRRR